MEKIVVKTQMSFRKGYNTVRFTKLPAGDRSVNAVFGQYAGNPYVGLIFSFDRPMQYLLLSGDRTVGNLKALEFGRSYMIYTSRAFTLDTTYWVGADARRRLQRHTAARSNTEPKQKTRRISPAGFF